MSVFRGNILEYSGVIVDRFNVSNCRRGRVFFLSHCHKDHMSGLDSDELLRALKERKVNFYCSEVTLALLNNDPEFTHLIPYLNSLPVQEPVSLQLIPFREDDSLINITVTLLPAGHCPGSVMFLFEGESGNVLYTGDFRLSMDELKGCGPLHNEITGDILNIRTLYLDTTFCHPKSMNIITRDETRDIIIRKTKEWLDASPDNIIHLNCRSFGYEHIFLSLSSQLNTKIHIDSWKMRSYCILPTVKDCLTDDGSTTRIHACSYKRGQHTPGLSCGYKLTQESSILHIKPSTQWFVTSGWNQPYKLVGNMLRVMHSMHASFSEIKEFVKYISPSSIIPCVIPATLGDTSLMNLHDRLSSLIPRSNTAATSTSSLQTDNSSLINRKRKLSHNRTTNESLQQASLNYKTESINIEAESFNEEAELKSDYETDDEILSPWASSFSSSHSDHYQSLTTLINLPALNNDDIIHNKPSNIQPVVSLSFDFEKTPSPVTSPVHKKIKQTSDDNDNETTPTFIDLTQSSDETNYDSHRNSNRTRSYSNSKSPGSIIVISDCGSPPVDIISLTSSSLRGTPDPSSVISLSSLKDTSSEAQKDTPLQSCSQKDTSRISSSSLKDTPPDQSFSQKDIPSHRSLSLKDTPRKLSSSSSKDTRSSASRSPSVVPLTPLKEDSESLLSKRSFIFM